LRLLNLVNTKFIFVISSSVNFSFINVTSYFKSWAYYLIGNGIFCGGKICIAWSITAYSTDLGWNGAYARDRDVERSRHCCLTRNVTNGALPLGTNAKRFGEKGTWCRSNIIAQSLENSFGVKTLHNGSVLRCSSIIGLFG